MSHWGVLTVTEETVQEGHEASRVVGPPSVRRSCSPVQSRLRAASGSPPPCPVGSKRKLPPGPPHCPQRKGDPHSERGGPGGPPSLARVRLAAAPPSWLTSPGCPGRSLCHTDWDSGATSRPRVCQRFFFPPSVCNWPPPKSLSSSGAVPALLLPVCFPGDPHCHHCPVRPRLQNGPGRVGWRSPREEPYVSRHCRLH